MTKSAARGARRALPQQWVALGENFVLFEPGDHLIPRVLGRILAVAGAIIGISRRSSQPLAAPPSACRPGLPGCLGPPRRRGRARALSSPPPAPWGSSAKAIF